MNATWRRVAALGVADVTISHDTVTGNDQGNVTGAPITTSPYAECNAAQHVPGDCGEGIHLESVTGSTVSGLATNAMPNTGVPEYAVTS